jgi:hypothetical protein
MIETARAAAVSANAWQLLPPIDGWDDLVLPPRNEERLRAVAAELRARFLDASGAQPIRPSRGKRGTRLLFWGPAGTGKTMAARVLGHELRRGVIEADLTSVLANERWRMARLFAIAARSGAVLVFDHFENLVARATDPDGSDRAGTANDISALLVRSAGHAGIVIFTVRLQHVADEAVPGHFDERIEFPFPGRAVREQIWRNQLAQTGLGETDISAVASALTISGGEIAACCTAAKQTAVRAGVPLRVDHVVWALEREWAPEPMPPGRHEALEALRSEMTSESGRSPDRERPAFDAGGKSISPTQTMPRPQPLAIAHPVAAPCPSRGRRRFSAGGALASVTQARGWVVGGLIGIVVAAVLGFALAGSGNDSTALPALDRRATAGPVLVSYPSSWRKRVPASPSGLALTNAVAFSPSESARPLLVLGTSASAGATLLPARFAASDPVVGQTVRLGPMWFYRFANLSQRGDPRPVSVYALPTTAGLVLSVCRPTGNEVTAACERILGALTLRPGIQMLVSSPDYARSLSDVIVKLNAARVRAASQIAAARTASAQGRAESRLANAQVRAASVVAALKAGPAEAANAALASSLKMTAEAYATMARAASQHDAAAYRAAGSSLAVASAATASALTDLKQFGYDER